jgi:hypothetical protein
MRKTLIRLGECHSSNLGSKLILHRSLHQIFLDVIFRLVHIGDVKKIFKKACNVQ